MSRQFPVWVFILFIGFDWLRWCFSLRSVWLLQQLQAPSRKLLFLVRFLRCRFARSLQLQGLSLGCIWSRWCYRSWFLVARLSWLVVFVYALFGSVLRSDAFKLFFLIGCPDLHPNVSRLIYLRLAACLMLRRDHQMFFKFFWNISFFASALISANDFCWGLLAVVCCRASQLVMNFRQSFFFALDGFEISHWFIASIC